MFFPLASVTSLVFPPFQLLLLGFLHKFFLLFLFPKGFSPKLSFINYYFINDKIDIKKFTI